MPDAGSVVEHGMKVEIWSDVVCPWCYIGKRRFEQALSRFAHRDEVEVVWRAFELDPTAVSAPAGEAAAGGHADKIASKYGMPVDQARQMVAQITQTAAGEGLDFHLDRAVAANTVDAHQVLHLAGERGVQGAVKERLLRAYFTEGEAVGDREVLVRLAAEAGLDADEVSSVLAQDRYVDAVRAEAAEASALGAGGVPFFVADRRYGVAGAQPADQMLEVLERAWQESRPLTLVGAPAGTGDGQAPAADACGPDGCPV